MLSLNKNTMPTQTRGQKRKFEKEDTYLLKTKEDIECLLSITSIVRMIVKADTKFAFQKQAWFNMLDDIERVANKYTCPEIRIETAPWGVSKAIFDRIIDVFNQCYPDKQVKLVLK